MYHVLRIFISTGQSHDKSEQVVEVVEVDIISGGKLTECN